MVVSLNFWDVFVLRGDAKLGAQISKAAAHWLELIVREHDSDSKPFSDVCANQGFEICEYVAGFHTITLAC